MLIIEDPTVTMKCRTAIKAVLKYTGPNQILEFIFI